VWFPILAPILFSVARMIKEKIWQFDYLMPAELFLVALAGGGLLILATYRACSHQRIIGWAFGIAVFLLVGGQIFAVVTGLASGRIEPAGWRWALVLASLGGYSLALSAMGIGGLLLIRQLFKPRTLTTRTL
jgi:hypothetical protein